MKIGICGHGRAGKDTAAIELAKHTPLRYAAGTSYWARHIVFDYMKARGYPYTDAHECWMDRHKYRELWAARIGEYNKHDPVQLYRDCLKDQDILTGVRWRHEQKACRAAGLVDLWIWIERPNFYFDPTIEFTAADCDVTILNDGTEAEYLEKLRRFARFLNISRSALAA